MTFSFSARKTLEDRQPSAKWGWLLLLLLLLDRSRVVSVQLLLLLLLRSGALSLFTLSIRNYLCAHI
jgi:hypothetical protein